MENASQVSKKLGLGSLCGILKGIFAEIFLEKHGRSIDNVERRWFVRVLLVRWCRWPGGVAGWYVHWCDFAQQHIVPLDVCKELVMLDIDNAIDSKSVARFSQEELHRW